MMKTFMATATECQCPTGETCVSHVMWQAWTMDFGSCIGDLGKAFAPSSGRGCNLIIGPVPPGDEVSIASAAASADTDVTQWEFRNEIPVYLSYGFTKHDKNHFPYCTTKPHKDMQALRPHVNGSRPFPPGVILKSVNGHDSWYILENLGVTDDRADRVTGKEVHLWKNGKKER